jgi:hypothetical protein
LSHPSVEVVLIKVVEHDEVGVDEVADEKVGDHVTHPVVGEEEQFAARLGKVVDAVAGMEDLKGGIICRDQNLGIIWWVFYLRIFTSGIS